MARQPLAHMKALQDGTQSSQSLREHLAEVADKAACFAEEFDSEQWARLAGVLHDVGKQDDRFQRRLAGADIHFEHSGAGAAIAHQLFGALGTPLAFVISGHHGGLPNAVESGPGLPTPLEPGRRHDLLERIASAGHSCNRDTDSL